MWLFHAVVLILHKSRRHDAIINQIGPKSNQRKAIYSGLLPRPSEKENNLFALDIHMKFCNRPISLSYRNSVEYLLKTTRLAQWYERRWRKGRELDSCMFLD